MGAFQGKWHIDLHISPTTKSFCPVFFAMVLIYCKDFKTLKIIGFGSLAGQIQHMAARKVGFTPRMLRQVALTGKAQLQWNLHIRAGLETYQLGPPALGACKNRTIIGLR
jgi:hypothetical protein